MRVADLDDWQKTFGQGRLLQAIAQTAEKKFVRPDAKGDSGADIVPTAAAAVEVHAAAIGNEPRFDCGIWHAENDRIITKIGMNISWRGQNIFEKLVTWSVRLSHGGLTPDVGFRGDGLFEPRKLAGAGRGRKQQNQGQEQETTVTLHGPSLPTSTRERCSKNETAAASDE